MGTSAVQSSSRHSRCISQGVELTFPSAGVHMFGEYRVITCGGKVSVQPLHLGVPLQHCCTPEAVCCNMTPEGPKLPRRTKPKGPLICSIVDPHLCESANLRYQKQKLWNLTPYKEVKNGNVDQGRTIVVRARGHEET